MKPAAGRLLLMVLLFAGWLGYLAYLAFSRPLTADGQPLVLSRPQLLEADLDVVARVDDPARPVVVKEVLFPPNEKDVHPEQKITVANLDRCRPVPLPGDYLLPLKRTEGDATHFTVALTPRSPGYPEPGPPRIYPATPQALAQYREIPKR
jgi:hypothetical protein